jgi:hypothetical protein
MCDSAPDRLLRHIFEGVHSAIEEHERRMHVPMSRLGWVVAVPLSEGQIDDSHLLDGLTGASTIEEVALALGVPALMLLQYLCKSQSAWRRLLDQRGNAQCAGND